MLCSLSWGQSTCSDMYDLECDASTNAVDLASTQMHDDTGPVPGVGYATCSTVMEVSPAEVVTQLVPPPSENNGLLVPYCPAAGMRQMQSEVTSMESLSADPACTAVGTSDTNAQVAASSADGGLSKLSGGNSFEIGIKFDVLVADDGIGEGAENPSKMRSPNLLRNQDVDMNVDSFESTKSAVVAASSADEGFVQQNGGNSLGDGSDLSTPVANDGTGLVGSTDSTKNAVFF